MTSKVCTLLPGLVDRADLPESIIKITQQTAPEGAWSCSIGATLAYRFGDYDRALELLEKSKEFPRIAYATAAIQPLLAMVQFKKGDEASAKKTLLEAKKSLDALRADETTRGFHDMVIAEMLFEEAQVTLGVSKP